MQVVFIIVSIFIMIFLSLIYVYLKLRNTVNTKIISTKGLFDFFKKANSEINAFWDDPYNLLDTIIDSVLLIDNTFHVKYANKSTVSIFGWTANELVGKTLDDLFENTTTKMRDLNLFLLSDHLENYDFSVKRKDGEKLSVLLSASRLLDKSGHNIGIVCTFKDVNRLKIAEEKLWKSEQSYRTLISNIPEVVYRTVDVMNWDFILLNDNIFKLTGYSKNDFLDGIIHFSDIILEDDKSKVKRLMYESMIEKKVFDFDFRVVHNDGSVRWVHVKGNGSYDKQGNIVSYEGIISDVTGTKLIEKELHRLNSNLSLQKEELEFIVHIRTLELQNAINTSSGNDKKRLVNLMASLVHELSTPLGMCFTALSFLNEKGTELKGAFENDRVSKTDFSQFINTFDEVISILNGNVDHSISLVKAFKQVVTEQIQDVKRNINVKGYFDEVILSLKPEISKKDHKIVLHVDPQLFITTFPSVLSQILINLIMNSLIHGFEKKDSGTIEISASVNNNVLTIMYTDNGCGIPEDSISKVFNLYYTTKKGRGGTGLGMSIIKELIENKLNGSISVTSKLDDFTTFTITFPL